MSSPQLHPATPAFTALLDAYARWQDFERMSAQGAFSPSNVSGSDEHAQFSIPISPSLAFIRACPYIDVSEIAEDDRSCPVCTDPYHQLSDQAKNRDLKIAQRLPCGHYLCNYCIYEWLNPFEKSNNNTCPFDRRVLFPKYANPGSTEGMQGRLDLIDWYNHARRRHPVGAERDVTRGLRTLLMQRRLGGAVEELEVDRFKVDILMHSKVGAREVADCLELLQFEHRLTTIKTIVGSMEGHVQTPTLQARLQCMTESLAMNQANVQEELDATDELEEGEIAEGSGRSQ